MPMPTRRHRTLLAVTLAAALIAVSCAVSDDTAGEPSTPTVRSTTRPAPEPPATVPSEEAAPTTSRCHPAYVNCIPNRPGDSLNCTDLTSAQKPVRLKQRGVDPYRLDGDGDGVGCESYSSSSGTRRQTDRTNGGTCTHDGRGHAFLGYNPGTHTHPTGHTHKTGKCAGV